MQWFQFHNALYCFDHSSSKTRSAVVLIRLPEDSGEDVDDDDDDGHAADGGVVLVAESIVLLTAGEALDQQDARGDHLSKGGKKTKEYVFLHLFPVCDLKQNGEGQ